MVWVGVGVMVAVGLWAAASAYAVMGLENAPYTVVEKRDGYEIRAYPALLVASTKTGKTGRDADAEAFRRLAGYIFGGNAKSQDIAMTVPVYIDSKPVETEMTFCLAIKTIKGHRTCAKRGRGQC